MKLRKSKKGFTVVELVIVIAVIAVLAAILIPTFISLDSRAKKASDQSLVSNLNTALAAREGEADDTHNDTMHDAVLDLEKWGYKLDALVTKSGEDLVWSSKENRFYLSKDKAVPASDPSFWRIQDDYNAETNYSIYAADGFKKSAIPGLQVGFDAGYNTGIASVEYTGSNDVVIRTNTFTTNVVVNTSGSVTHYGKVGKLDIQKVAMESFHEFGDARTVTLKEGNLIIEKGGSATLVSVTATEAGKAKLDIQGDLEVLAGSASNYTVTSGQPTTTVNAPIADDTLAIVNGAAKTSLSNDDFADGNTVVLLKDYNETQVTLGSCTVVGNLTKLNALVPSNKTIVLKNIHTTTIKVTDSKDFNSSLTFDGGLLETNVPGTSDSNAAFYAPKGSGSYTFKNMTVASNITKGIKIAAAKSVTIENCDFDASRLAITSGVSSDLRSLSLIDIQEGNTRRGNGQQMSVKISGNTFVGAVQGEPKVGVADSDTAAAIKIKAEDVGFSSVEITNNSFTNCYRDVAAGVNVMTDSSSSGFNAQKCPALLKSELNNVATWNIADNKSNGKADRGILLVTDGNSTTSHAYADKLGEMIGGCAVYNTYKTTKLTATSTKAEANALMGL